MEQLYITIGEAAQKWGISPRRIQRLCSEGRIPGANKHQYAWRIPAQAQRPRDKRRPVPPPLYPGLFLLEDIVFDGRPMEDLADTLPDAETKREFWAEAALFQGDYATAKSLGAAMPEDSCYRVSNLMGQNIMAAQTGNLTALSQGLKALAVLRQTYAEDPSAQGSIDLAEATIYASIYDIDHCASWLLEGDFSRVPPCTRLNALYLHTRIVHARGNANGWVYGLASAGLMLSPGPGFTYVHLYLLVMCAITEVARENRTKARDYLRQALDYALPYGFILPFAENLTLLKGELELLLKAEYQEAYDPILKAWHRVFTGWASVHFKDKPLLPPGESLSLREVQMASYLCEGLTQKEIANRMGLNPSTFRHTLQILREKLGAATTRDAVSRIGWYKGEFYGNTEDEEVT